MFYLASVCTGRKLSSGDNTLLGSVKPVCSRCCLSLEKKEKKPLEYVQRNFSLDLKLKREELTFPTTLLGYQKADFALN